MNSVQAMSDTNPQAGYNAKESDKMTNKEMYQAFLNKCRSKGLSPETMKIYKHAVEKLVEFLEGKEPTPEQIDAFTISLLDKGLKPNSVNSYLRAIRRFLRFCAKREYIGRYEVIEMVESGPPNKKVLNETEVQQVLDACDPENRFQMRDRCLILVLLSTGMRRGELLRMKWGDIDRVTGAVQILESKTKTQRTVIIDHRVLEELEAWSRILILNGEGDPLFRPNDPVFKFSKNGLRSCVLRISKRSGVEFSPHVLRATFITLCIKAKMPLSMIQRLAGHDDIRTTQIYERLVFDDIMEAFEEHSPLSRLQEKGDSR